MDAPQLRLQDSDQDNLACGKQKAATSVPREQIAAKNYDYTWTEEHETWRQSDDIHSCRHCRQFRVVRNPKPFTFPIRRGPDLPGESDTASIRVCIADKISDIWQALDDGCPLFEIWFEEYRGRKDSELLDAFDIDGSGMVQAVCWGIGKTVDVHGYVDLALLCRKHENCDLYPYIEWLRTIIQPDQPRETLTCDPCAPDSFEICLDLMSRCLLSHPLCRMPPSSFIPTRLLDVIECGLRLVETSEIDQSERHEWCALSYVWGGDVPLKTTKATRFAHKECIPLDTLPKTMKDAVSVCRGMGIRYLWIDALCIIQDDQEDLREEINHMPEVYQYAALTICAASSTSIHDGFLYRRGYWSHTFPATNIRIAADSGESISLFVYLCLNSGAFRYRKEPILQRAWTYQEDMLSPRILNYRTHHLEWKCRTHAELVGAPGFGFFKTPMIKFDRSEKGQQETLITNHSTYKLSSSTSWLDVVIEYSKREASLASDKLRALSAIARVYHLETGKEYLAGLWKEDIPAALCWANGITPGSPGYTITSLLISPRPKEYRAPSWSWASVNTPVHYWGHKYHDAPVKPRNLQVLDAGITPTYPNGEYDSIASGFLVVRGPVRAWALPTPVELYEFKSADPRNLWENIWIEEVNAHVYPDAIEDSHEMLDILWFLLLAEQDEKVHPEPKCRKPATSYWGLVLKQAKAHPNTFCRIGYFTTNPIFEPGCDWPHYKDPYTPAMFFDQFEDRTITLI